MRLARLAFGLCAVFTAIHAQQESSVFGGSGTLRDRSSRFRKLTGTCTRFFLKNRFHINCCTFTAAVLTDNGQSDSSPVDLRFDPNAAGPQGPVPADQSGSSLFANSGAQAATIVPGFTQSNPFGPFGPQPGATTPKPLRIPPVIAEILGIQNLGIPGLIETGPPGPVASPAGQQSGNQAAFDSASEFGIL